MRMKIYGLLVNRVPEIQRKYHSVRDHQTMGWERWYAWALLLGMNAAWLLGKRKFGDDPLLYPDQEKKLPKGQSESALSCREAPEKLAERLLEHDVISFDIFDTLLFRPFSRPTDLFYAAGGKLGYPDFTRLRVEMERRAREQKYREEGHREVTLAEIYRLLETFAGIPAEKGMRTEIETEWEFCFANPYMKAVFDLVKEKAEQKVLIAVSDMYLPVDSIQKMLEKCGYSGFTEIYISGALQSSKSDGGLYAQINRIYGSKSRYAHVGDHPISDVTNARKAGWDAYHYRNVNEAGACCRTEEMSVVAGSVYRGLVNAHIHNGLWRYSSHYEFGYIYGGLFALGYCQFIHQYVKANRIDKLLFLSRDGDILKQVYEKLYPEEKETAYVLWSRLAATKLCAGYFKYDYFRRFLYHKVNQNYRLEEILATMELTDLLPVLEEAGWQSKTHLTDRNVNGIRDFLQLHWNEVLAHYEPQIEEAGRYYGKILQGCKKAAAVDIGWAGSGAVCLNYLAREVWKLDCSIVGLLAGTNALRNAEPDMSEAMLANGSLESYVFSQRHNREIWKHHDPGQGDNVVMERLLASPLPSFRGFTPGTAAAAGTEQQFRPEGEPGKEAKEALEIQKGILDFCDDYLGKAAPYLPLTISGSDSTAPIRLWMEKQSQARAGMNDACVLE